MFLPLPAPTHILIQLISPQLQHQITGEQRVELDEISPHQDEVHEVSMLSTQVIDEFVGVKFGKAYVSALVGGNHRVHEGVMCWFIVVDLWLHYIYYISTFPPSIFNFLSYQGTHIGKLHLL